MVLFEALDVEGGFVGLDEGGRFGAHGRCFSYIFVQTKPYSGQDRCTQRSAVVPVLRIDETDAIRVAIASASITVS